MRSLSNVAWFVFSEAFSWAMRSCETVTSALLGLTTASARCRLATDASTACCNRPIVCFCAQLFVFAPLRRLRSG